MQWESLKERSRSGQALVETAVTLPFVIFAILAVLQGGWLAFCGTTLSSAVAGAQYSVTLDDVAGAGADAALADKIRASSPIFTTGTLSVTGTTIVRADDAVRSAELPDSEFASYRFATKNESTSRISVTSHIEYTPISLFGGAFRPRFVREVAANRICEERFELG